MTLFIFFTMLLLIIAYYMLKDRRYLKKTTREVVSDDVKKLLNIPTQSDVFPNRVLPNVPKISASAKLLKELNDENES